MTLACTMPPPPAGRRRPGGRPTRVNATGVYTVGTPRNDFRLDVTGVGTEKKRGRSSPVGKRCPNLGPTRQDTLIYFKTNGRPNSEKQKLVASHASGPPKTAPPALPGTHFEQADDVGEKVDDEVSGTDGSAGEADDNVNSGTESRDSSACSDQSGDQSQNVLDSASYRRLCLSSLVLRRENTFMSTRPGSYVSDYQIRPSSVTMVSVPRSRMSRKREKVITPSKHGYHPRSHSPTFKRLLQASDKLNRLLENLSSSVVTPDLPRPETTTTSEADVDSGQNCSTDGDIDFTSNTSIDVYEIAVRPCKGYESNSGAREKYKDESGASVRKHHVTPRVGIPNDIKVDYRQNGAELHFFLPNIVPISGDHTLTPEGTACDEKTPVTSRSLPKLDAKVNPPNSSKPKNGLSKRTRIISKRSLSPVKAANKDKQRKGRLVEEKEPFLRGESLKERLEDFPTLVSLDTS